MLLFLPMVPFPVHPFLFVMTSDITTLELLLFIPPFMSFIVSHGIG